eukprot:g8845.t1
MDHGTAPEGMECACCYDDIVGGKGGNYVEYRTGEGKPWLPSLFCKGCIKMLIKRQWSIYEETLAKATCKAQQKRMLGEGPPTHLHDKKALKCEEGESVHSLWYVGDDHGEPQVQSALLEGAPQGEARQIWWDEKLAFQFDEDDDEEDDKGKEKGKSKPADPDAIASTPPPVPGTASPPPVPPPAAAPATADTAAAKSQDGGQGADSEATSTSTLTESMATVGGAVAGGAVDAAAVAVKAEAPATAPSDMAVEGEAGGAEVAGAVGAVALAVKVDPAVTAPSDMAVEGEASTSAAVAASSVPLA